MALGLNRIVPPGKLIVVANTGDDFEHLGLHVTPDIDTLIYTLAGLDNPETGCGRRDETWTFMAALDALGARRGFAWAMPTLPCTSNEHDGFVSARLFRKSLEASQAGLACRRMVTMADDRVRTRVHTVDGWLDFQRYFVEFQCRPAVRGFAFDGAAQATPHPDFLAALRHPRLRASWSVPSMRS